MHQQLAYHQTFPGGAIRYLGAHAAQHMYNTWTGGKNRTLKKRKYVPKPQFGFPRTRNKKMLHSFHEKKFLDTGFTGVLTTAWATAEDGTNDSITGVAQGDGESNRDGRRYTITSIHVNGFFQYISTEGNTNPVADSYARIIVVWDKQTNGAQLTATDVMADAAGGNFLAFRELEFTDRFQVLYDKKAIVRPHTTNEGASNLFAHKESKLNFQFHKYFKNGIKVNTSLTTGVIASIVDNSIHVIAIANPVVTLVYQARCRFFG